MNRKEIDELNALAQKILIICAQAEIDNREYEERARQNRERFVLVKKQKEGMENDEEVR